MRISDWSSDVCSSDLPGHLRQRPVVEPRTGFFRRSQAMNDLFRKTALPVILLASTVLFAGCATQGKPPPVISLDEPVQAQPLPEPPAPVEVVAVPEVLPMPAQLRSEEHTSELQSLMRISYAVFCLKKKKNTIRKP